VRRLLDLVLLLAILGAVGFGALTLGKRVDTTSNTLAKHDSELTQKVARPHVSRRGPSRRTIELVVGGVGGGAALLLLWSAAGAASRRQRRQRWRAT
jgi:hypothetical protein